MIEGAIFADDDDGVLDRRGGDSAPAVRAVGSGGVRRGLLRHDGVGAPTRARIAAVTTARLRNRFAIFEICMVLSPSSYVGFGGNCPLLVTHKAEILALQSYKTISCQAFFGCLQAICHYYENFMARHFLLVKLTSCWRWINTSIISITYRLRPPLCRPGGVACSNDSERRCASSLNHARLQQPLARAQHKLTHG